jgi:hypothetical protein
VVDENDLNPVKKKFTGNVTDSEIVIDDNDDIHKNKYLQQMLLILGY